MSRAFRLIFGLALASSVGCTDGMTTPLGLDTRVRFHDGKGNYLQHVDGRLPGAKPLDDGASAAAGASSTDAGPVVSYSVAPGWVYQGQSNAKFEGKLSSESVAVGMAVADVAGGYWVKPAGILEPVEQILTWDAYLDVADGVKPGYHDVTFVGIDDDGNAGQQVKKSLCIRSRVPDNLNACEPSSDAPRAVISLKWDANVDLDLQVVDPKGNVVDSKNRATAPTGEATDPNAGTLDRDSNAGCVIDGIRYENLVWNGDVSPQGRYGIYVNLFDSCKLASVHFEVSVWVAKDVSDTGRTLKQYYSQSGVMMDFQANAGTGRGLFITDFDFK